MDVKPLDDELSKMTRTVQLVYATIVYATAVLKDVSLDSLIVAARHVSKDARKFDGLRIGKSVLVDLALCTLASSAGRLNAKSQQAAELTASFAVGHSGTDVRGSRPPSWSPTDAGSPQETE